MPCVSENTFRFNENSGNLARCFGCETNFNPIDMVIAVKKNGFRQSADFPTGLLESDVVAKQDAPAARGVIVKFSKWLEETGIVEKSAEANARPSARRV